MDTNTRNRTSNHPHNNNQQQQQLITNELKQFLLPRVVVMDTNTTSSSSSSRLPVPDYDDDDDEDEDAAEDNSASIIRPKKLVNPVKESKLRMNIHRELMFNQKMGVSVLNKKTDLEKTIAKIKSKHSSDPTPPQSEVIPTTTTTNGEFQKVLMERKKIIDNYEISHDNQQTTETEEDEFRKVHRKIFK